MNWILPAIAVMSFATLGAHLGLFEAIVKVATKISKCNMCSTFWLSMVVLPLMGCPLHITALLAISFAYLSNYLLLLLLSLQKLYDKLWQKINHKQ